jgi:hypothetical protein
MEKQTNKRRCALCRQALPRSASPPRVPVTATFEAAISEAVQDIEAWADGDALADDGELLWKSDLLEYLAHLLAPPLMRTYRERLNRERNRLLSREAREHFKENVVSIVDRVQAATIERQQNDKRTGAPPKDYCVNGHRRTPENTRRSGACVQCHREDSARRNAEQKARKQRDAMEKSELAGGDDANTL